ncbi:SIR2 family NAD-dependent protein deacylase [Membranihabitans maritimus]|uniref:SIR2 family NAD-dependent protein deacylase n=1 Tax=Membranihabitans maritimus TaxID=2904244 RepID=UPI001F25D897|nr:NAD-dependent deacylase [Membranihabitans maritimus]
MGRNKLVVLTGAGISAESGIKTFRDENGLWEGHDVMEVASPEGFRKNPELVLDFYNQRRRQLFSVSPNSAHKFLAELEDAFEVTIITQNVDDLHERSGSKNIIHLHGELLKVRSVDNEQEILDWESDLLLSHRSPGGSRLRPHIVWFGEAVPAMEMAIKKCTEADICLVIGTSLQVYPAAGLTQYCQGHIPVFYVDPSPNINYEMSLRDKLTIISKKATDSLLELKEQLAKLQ